MSRVVFVTGTDTGVGKSLSTALLLKHAVSQGQCAIGLKPIASGCESTSLGLRNLDALLLQSASAIDLPYEWINPITVKQPIAPHIGLARSSSNYAMDLDKFVAGMLTNIQTYSEEVDLVLVEGAGGWRVPLVEGHDFSDMAQRLTKEVVLVVGVKLGCINHARLTAEAIERDGCRVVGWVANCLDSDMACLEENIACLSKVLPAPLLMQVPFINRSYVSLGAYNDSAQARVKQLNEGVAGEFSKDFQRDLMHELKTLQGAYDLIDLQNITLI